MEVESAYQRASYGSSETVCLYTRIYDSVILIYPGIRLIRQLDNNGTDAAKGFYLFSDNCSEKEDFYHAMLNAQENQKDPTDTDHPLPRKRTSILAGSMR